MILLDERLLEALRDDGPLSTGMLAREYPLDATGGRISDRLQILAHAEFVAPFGGVVDLPPDWWVIDTKGREYLRGDLDARYHRPLPGYRRHVGGRTAGTVTSKCLRN